MSRREMDIDISDILADVSRPFGHSSSSTTGQQQHQSLPDSNTSHSDHQLLVRAWTSERCSPSLLPYPTSLIERTTQRISAQIAKIEDMTAGVDLGVPSDTTAAHHHAPSNSNNNRNINLILSILQTDLGRTQFILRSYLRQRLAKITKYAVYHLKHHVPTTATTMDSTSSSSASAARSTPLLSPAETVFLQNHQALLSRFYDDSFLASFPANLRRLDDRSGGMDMVQGPDWDCAVVVRCLRESGWGNEEDVFGDEEQDGDDGDGGGGGDGRATTELRMARDEVWVVRWRDVKKGVVGGDLELL